MSQAPSANPPDTGTTSTQVQKLARPHTVLPCSPPSQTRHVVFIGDTGSGKSSVIRLIADRDDAVPAVSPDVSPCTRDFASYEVLIGGRRFMLWDTPGLNAPSRFRLFRRSSSTSFSTKESIKKFLQDRYRIGELDLLVFCVPGSRAHEGMSKAYKTFCRATHRFSVPVVVAVTHLERAQPTMDAWWQSNERMLENLGLVFDGHVCITCLSPHHRKWASQQEIYDLISREYPQRPRSTLSDGAEYLDDPRRVPCVIC